MKRIKLFLMAAALVGGTALLASCANDDNVAPAVIPAIEGDVEVTALTGTSFQFEMPEGDVEIEVEYYE